MLILRRHGVERRHRHGHDAGQDHDGKHHDGAEQAGTGGLAEGLCHGGHQHLHTQKAEHHAGDAGQQLDGGDHHGAQLGVGGLGEEHRRQQADGHADDDRARGDVDAAEDRELFDEILEKCHIDRPRGSTVFTTEEAIEVANKLGYPVLVRPSYVLGGAGMEIALNDGDIKKFMKIINRQYQEHPILIDKYLSGKEVEVDAVCDGHGILIPGIMEHVERAGVHSGDSISVYPPQKIKQEIKDVIVDYTKRLAKALHVVGLINIQFIVYEDQVYVIEVNPRSSRTIPYISKVTDIPIVAIATKAIMGHTIEEQGYSYGIVPEKETIAVKMPVFSFEKIKGAEISLGPEMKSTGEVLGISKNLDEAIYKAFMGTGIQLPKRKNIICTIKDSSKEEFLPIAKQYYMFGYDLYATEGTYKFLKEHDVPVHFVNRICEKTNTIFDLMFTDTVDLVIDIPTRNDNLKDGFLIRRFAVEAGIPIYTSLDTAKALIDSLEKRKQGVPSLIDITKLR
mgnify:CR=1 FL=1